MSKVVDGILQTKRVYRNDKYEVVKQDIVIPLNQIVRFESSYVYGSKCSDVFLVDGSDMVLDIPFEELKEIWFNNLNKSKLGL